MGYYNPISVRAVQLSLLSIENCFRSFVEEDLFYTLQRFSERCKAIANSMANIQLSSILQIQRFRPLHLRHTMLLTESSRYQETFSTLLFSKNYYFEKRKPSRRFPKSHNFKLIESSENLYLSYPYDHTFLSSSLSLISHIIHYNYFHSKPLP